MDGLHGVNGWQGWQWLFLLEGLPSVVLGFVVLWILPDRPADVRWLTVEEKAALSEALHSPASAAIPGSERHRHTLREALGDGRVWLLSFIYFIFAMALYGLTLWVPQIIKDVAGGAGLLLGTGPVVTLAALSLGVMALFSSFGPFWTLPAAFLRGTAAAGGIAVINLFGNLGGFVSPWLVGLIKKQTGSFTGGIAVIAGSLLLAALLVAVGTRRREAPAEVPV